MNDADKTVSETLQEHWVSHFFLGLLRVILGLIAIGASAFTTKITVFILGLIVFVAGIAQIAQLSRANKLGGTLFPPLLGGVVYLIFGALCLLRPEVSALALTALFGAMCLLMGMFRMISAVVLRYEGWWLVLTAGILSFIIGWIIFSGWPYTGLSFIGILVGVELILSGVTWMLLVPLYKQKYIR